MTTRFLIYSCLLVLLMGGLNSCKKLEEINNDPTRPITTKPQYLMAAAQKSSMDIINQGMQNGRTGMHYAQYWTGNSRANDSRYLLDEGINSGLWNTLYAGAVRDLEEIIRLNNANKQPTPGIVNQNAIARIMQVWIYQMLTDAYGNIPYFSAMRGETDIKPKYDDARTVYNALIDTLTAQTKKLDITLPGYDTGGDIIYNGNVAAWKKLAHSLLLRLAIRIADADPAKAKSVIEANYQLAMTDNADNAQFKYQSVAPNKYPFNDSERDITDFFVTTTLVDYMKSVQDPRLDTFARGTKSNPKVINGMAYGTSESNKNRLSQDKYSIPGYTMYSATMPGILMTYPEVEFALAEAAARGFAVGADAAEHYRKGVTASFLYWKFTAASADDYLKRVPYNAADWKNVIGSQKWLALYPQGLQGWFERIRLDIKKPGGDTLFIMPVDPSLDQNVKYVPFRLTYLISEQTQNSANYQQAAKAIGGDTKGTRIWWDKF